MIKSDWGVFYHDKDYDEEGAIGPSDAFFNTKNGIIWADIKLTARSYAIYINHFNSFEYRLKGGAITTLFGAIVLFKIFIKKPLDKVDDTVKEYHKKQDYTTPRISWDQIKY